MTKALPPTTTRLGSLQHAKLNHQRGKHETMGLRCSWTIPCNHIIGHRRLCLESNELFENMWIIEESVGVSIY